MSPESHVFAQNQTENILRRKIELVENSEIDIVNKLSLVLLLLNEEKRGALVGPRVVPIENGKIKITSEMLRESENILRLISRLGLYYPDIKELGLSGMSYLVTKDQSILNKLITAYKDKDDKTLGSIFAYPETAINAHGTKDQLNWEDLPVSEKERLHIAEMLPFLNFTGSREHYTEELEAAKKNMELIKENAPSLFKELTTHQFA
jgi:hypothetical protein